MPGPVTNFEKILEYQQIEWVSEKSKPKEPNPFYVLLLSEGFEEKDRAKFTAVVRDLEKELFRISPFTFCRPYIGLLCCFLPSKVSGMEGKADEDELDSEGKTVWRRVFRLKKNERGDNLTATDDKHTLEVVKRLKVPTDLLPPHGFTCDAGDIWCRRSYIRRGSIVVIANATPIPASKGELGFWPANTFTPKVTEGNPAEEYCTSWCVIGIEDPSRPKGWSVNTLAHELGHTLGLDDEYDTSGSDKPGVAGVEDRMGLGEGGANVQQINVGATLLSSELDANPTWRLILSEAERVELDKPNSALLFTKARLKEKNVTLEPNDLDRNVYLILPGTEKGLHWSRMYLVEGAARYRHGVFRSNFECRMRFDTYDERIPGYNPGKYTYSREGRQYYGAPEFCKVCNFAIRKRITGWDSFGMGATDRRFLEDLFHRELIPRAEKSFELQVPAGSVDTAVCDIASARLYIMMKQLDLDARFAITPKHVSIYLNGVYLDPTFYDWYRTSAAETSLSFIDGQTGETCTFASRGIDTKVGKLGDLREFEVHMLAYRPVPDSNFTPETTPIEQLRRYYVPSGGYWEGPFRYPNLTQEELDRLDQRIPGAGAFVPTIMVQWNKWCSYLDRTDGYDYYRPLDLAVPISEI